jgi:hypothetical protein
VRHKAPELPDFALTAYQAGGWSSTYALVRAGVLDAGDYRCPECDGHGDIDMILCRDCGGFGAMKVLDYGAFWSRPEERA